MVGRRSFIMEMETEIGVGANARLETIMTNLQVYGGCRQNRTLDTPAMIMTGIPCFAQGSPQC